MYFHHFLSFGHTSSPLVALGLGPCHPLVCSLPKDWVRLDGLLRDLSKAVFFFTLYAPIATSPFHCDGQPWCQWPCWTAAPLPLTYLYTCGWLSTSGQIKVPVPRPDYIPPLCIYDWGYTWKHSTQPWQSWTWLSQVKLTWNWALGLELAW